VLVSTPDQFTVTAKNSGGSTSVKLNIKVIAVAPEITFSPVAYTYIHKSCEAPVEVRNTAGPYAAITSCSISQALPKGLVFNGASCAIHGCAEEIFWPPQTFLVTAKNTGGSSTATVSIGVKAIAPNELYYTDGSEAVFTATKVIDTDMALVDVESDPITINTVTPPLPKGLKFDAKYGIITGTPADVTPRTCHTFVAGNTGGAVDFEQCITVNAVPPSCLCYDGCKANGCAGKEEITLTLGHKVSEGPSLNVDAMAGDAKLTYSVANLPAGLSLDTSTGVISGTPTELAPAFKDYQVTVTNSGGSSSVTLAIRVIAVCPVIKYSPKEYILTRAVSYTNARIINLAGPNAVTTRCELLEPEGVRFPEGLQFNSQTCEISGQPTVVSWPPKTYYVIGGNSCGSAPLTSITIGVKAIAPRQPTYWSGGRNVVLTVNKAMEVDMPYVTGDKITHWHVTPALPAGLTMSKTDGSISGTPTEVQTIKTYTLFASNTGGSITFKQSITVHAAPLHSLVNCRRCQSGLVCWQQ
jgi:hypothetical protein